MTTIYLIRHAQADGNLYRRCQAWYDGLITQTGYRQIEALSRRFANIPVDAVYSSDLFRTMTTARAICTPHNLSLHIDPQLREIGSGVWEDVPWGELLQTQRDSLLAFWRCDPTWQVEGGETFEGVQKRFDGAVRKIASSHPEQTIAIFAHGCVIRSTLAFWLGLPLSRIREIPHGDNTSVARLEYEDGNIRVCWYNDISHLTGDLAHAPHPAAESDEATAAGIERASIYFRPMNLPAEKDIYLAARKNAWQCSHGQAPGFESNNFLDSALRCYKDDPNSILLAMLGGKPVGILQMDFQAEKSLGVGRIPFVYLDPAIRNNGLGVQLIGQAVSSYRALGRKFIRLRCGAQNARAQAFYKKHGFYKIGEEPGGTGVLDTLERPISPDI